MSKMLLFTFHIWKDSIEFFHKQALPSLLAVKNAIKFFVGKKTKLPADQPYFLIKQWKGNKLNVQNAQNVQKTDWCRLPLPNLPISQSLFEQHVNVQKIVDIGHLNAPFFYKDCAGVNSENICHQEANINKDIDV